MKETLKLGVILFIITAIAGVLLGFAYEITKEPIAKQEMLERTAVGEVLPEAKEVKKIEIPEHAVVKEMNAAYDGDKLIGHTILVAPKGFKGPVEFVFGVYENGKIGGVKIIKHSETPGLGSNIEKDSFKVQFKDKGIEDALAVVKTAPSNPNEIQAISGATITSNAFTSGMNEGLKLFRTVVKGEAAEPEKTKESVVKSILPDYTKLEAAGVEIPADSKIIEADKVFVGDNHVAYAVKAKGAGFEGDIEAIVVISTDNKILGVRVWSHSETPGLGGEIEKDEFTSQFKDKSAAEKLGEINAVSGATYSTDGMKEAVNNATEFYRTKLSGK